MYRDQKLELRVGMFIGMSLFICFLIVFSISDFYIFKGGYNLNISFDYVNGITKNAPVRLAGVRIGDVRDIKIFYDTVAEKTRVKLDVWIEGPETRIEKDSVARINTLGLLGEQYLEITPGVSKEFLKEGETVIGKNPANMGIQMERMSRVMDSFSDVLSRLEKGEGTFGKLMTDDALYNDLETIFSRLKNGEGTIGKLLVEEKVYNDVEEFVGDIKANPWKLLQKPREPIKKDNAGKNRKGTEVSHR
ncbi:MAG: MlaD family protein [Candidatus Omnitrophica bacterium]|nr:MlaD family protein [Candidatus Omnitrophota bacterium]